MAALESLGVSVQPLQDRFGVNSTPIREACVVEEEARFNTPSTPATNAFTRTTIERLPNELLANIFSHIDPLRPSLALLHDEPTFDLTQCEIKDLKSVSRVSKRWRQAILPQLFRHAQFKVKETDLQRKYLDDQLRPFFVFVLQNKLRKAISSFVLIVHDKKVANGHSKPDDTNSLSVFWELLFAVIDPVDLLIVAPAEALGTLTSCHVRIGDVWCFDCPCQYLRLQRPATSEAPERNDLSTNVDVNTEELLSGVAVNAAVEATTSTSFVDMSGNVASTTGTVIAPLQGSSSREIFLSSGHATRSISAPLFEYRPWTKLLLNEGSFVRAYATYEFWLREPPSILSDLLGCDTPPRKALITPSIRDMEYIGVFPMASHFSNLTKHCPRLDRLYIQVVPRNEILQDTRKMSQVEPEDLWMERNSCYALLMRELFNSPPMGNYRHLRVFESGDAADKDAWNMAVEFVKRASGHAWKVVADGVFAREPVASPTDKEGGDDENPTSLSVNSSSTGL